MSDEAELGRIQRPPGVPPEQPDQKTAAEEQELTRQKRSPTERESDAHASHQKTMRERIDYHCQEIEHLRGDAETLHRRLGESTLRCEKLVARCEKLETATSAVSCANLLGTLEVAVGGAALGYAGAYPGLTDQTKLASSIPGFAVTGCEIVTLLAGFAFGILKTRGG